MDYKEYYKTYYNYRQATNKLHKIQNDLADVINALLSVSAQLKDVVTSGGGSNNKILDLTMKKVDLEAKEPLAKELVAVREKQKNDAEKELRKSKENKDVIYYKYFIDHIKVKEISEQIPLAREYTYDLLKQIRQDMALIDKEMREKNRKK